MRSYLLVCLCACVPQVTPDANETTLSGPGPTALFDPASLVVPMPTSLIVDPVTGKLNIPAQCGENAAATAIRTNALNQLDGYSVLKSGASIAFSAAVDQDSLTDHVFLLRRVTTQPTSAPDVVPIVAKAVTTPASTGACGSPKETYSVVIVPTIPLSGSSVYTVVLLSGITSGGTTVLPSYTWSLARQQDAPVQLDDAGDITVNNSPFDITTSSGLGSAKQLAGLWAAQQPGLINATTVLGSKVQSRDDFLLAYEFPTQSIDAVFAGQTETPAPLVVDGTVSGASGYEGAEGPTACTVYNCAAVASVTSAHFTAPNDQPWITPEHPVKVGDEQIEVLIFTPQNSDANKTVIFGHGLGGRKENAYTVAADFAAQGITVVAMDWLDHGARAVSGASFLSADLVTTRSNILQSQLELQQLARVLQACVGNVCGQIHVGSLGYIGQSLGSDLGSVGVAMSPAIKAAVFNVGGGGWVDQLLETQDPYISCPLVDGLIAAGILQGGLSTSATPLCLDPTWPTQPGIAALAPVAQWLLNPGDGYNYAHHFTEPGAALVLMQEVTTDTTLVKPVLDGFAALAGLPRSASYAGDPVAATPAAAGHTRALIEYTTGAVDAYQHSSITTPAAGAAGAHGTAQMRLDAVTFLKSNL